MASSTRSPSPRTLPRTRSVQIREQPDITSSASHRAESNDVSGNHESSADEITPIITHPRGGSKRYDGSGGPAPQSPSRSSTSSMRKRRKRGQEPNDEGNEGCSDTGVERKGAHRLTAWIRDTAEKYGSIELENKGSTARDHLALERTFLAWLRTSLAFASIGIAITQLFRLNTTIERREGRQPSDTAGGYHLRQVGKPLGATFLGIAIVVLLVGGRRYFESQYWIMRGKFPASRGSVFLITFVAAALIVTSLVVVCVVDPSVFEKR
ncbi:uncharacterized protein KY384_008233 [Bacidia gigantensis]|uniref:uncharacterized protein n=1 Tax=Bacidia gigantensis TaxID=2732470 RepID=UPI001D03C631|nr:uncharacterized protein KY384_008233 [Bacidia gigantensis]KAG8526804.1 hypothetical protein KY384_008233 [Bacidia gigantensis]